jgi:hypothetical protein
MFVCRLIRPLGERWKSLKSRRIQGERSRGVFHLKITSLIIHFTRIKGSSFLILHPCGSEDISTEFNKKILFVSEKVSQSIIPSPLDWPISLPSKTNESTGASRLPCSWKLLIQILVECRSSQLQSQQEQLRSQGGTSPTHFIPLPTPFSSLDRISACRRPAPSCPPSLPSLCCPPPFDFIASPSLFFPSSRHPHPQLANMPSIFPSTLLIFDEKERKFLTQGIRDKNLKHSIQVNNSLDESPLAEISVESSGS